MEKDIGLWAASISMKYNVETIFVINFSILGISIDFR